MIVIGAGDNKHKTQTKEDPRHPSKGSLSRKMVHAVLEKLCPHHREKNEKRKKANILALKKNVLYICDICIKTFENPLQVSDISIGSNHMTMTKHFSAYRTQLF